MSTEFQRAVRSGVPTDRRLEAIETLIERNERQNLATIVQTGGLRGVFRRRALEGLAVCNASECLEALAENTMIDPVLRKRAGDLV